MRRTLKGRTGDVEAAPGAQGEPTLVYRGSGSSGIHQSFRSWYRRHERLVLGTAGIASFLLLWELGSRSGFLNSFVFSSPAGVISALVIEVGRGELWQHLGTSMVHFFLGFSLAAIVGVAFGFLAGWSRLAQNLLDPWVTLLNSTPKAALVPMIIIIFGIDLPSKVAFVFLSSVLVVIVNTQYGVQNTSSRLVNVGRVFGASRLKLWTSVVLPGSLPNILTGLRLAGMSAMIAVIIAELVAGNYGIGFMLSAAGANLRTGTVMLLVLFLGFWGIGFAEVMRAVEARYEPWRPKRGG
jgi:NitT/TauT family transport system permease protein